MCAHDRVKRDSRIRSGGPCIISLSLIISLTECLMIMTCMARRSSEVLIVKPAQAAHISSQHDEREIVFNEMFAAGSGSHCRVGCCVS